MELTTTDKHCLICRTNFHGDANNTSIITPPNGEQVTIKKESRDFIVSSSHEDFHIENQLKSVFILRNLLDFSEVQCGNYLKQNDGSQNPGSWFSLCSKCNDVIEESHHIYREVLRWKRKLDKKKDWLKIQIEKSRGTNWEEVSRNLENLLSDNSPSENIRKSDPFLSQLQVKSFELSPYRRSTRVRKRVETSYKESECELPEDDGLFQPATSPTNEESNHVDCSEDHLDDDWHPSFAKVPVYSAENGSLSLSCSTVEIQNIQSDGADTSSEYKCAECVASYKSLKLAIRHREVHKMPVGHRSFTCKNCGWVFRSKIPKKHKLNQCFTSSNVFECKLCPAKFQSNKSYANHLALHEMPHEMCTCGKCGIVMSRNAIKSHLRVHKNADVKKAKSIQKKELKIEDKHRKTKQPEEEIPYYCDHCHLIFTSRRALSRHFNMAHKKYTPLLECDMCSNSNTKFESKQLLQMHRKLVHLTSDDATGTTSMNIECAAEQTNSPEKSIASCSHCEETFPTKIKMDYHIAKVHWATQLICPVCKEFSAREFALLREHMRTHDPNEITMCEICSKMIRKVSVPGHMQLFHYKELGLEPIQCRECKMIFRSQVDLKKHMNLVHLHNVANCCHLCPKQFKWKCDLNKHIERHLKPKGYKYKKGPFFCKICQAKFNVRQSLYYHMKRLHSDKYLYRCDKCGKGYCSENTLNDHEKSCKAENNKQ